MGQIKNIKLHIVTDIKLKHPKHMEWIILLSSAFVLIIFVFVLALYGDYENIYRKYTPYTEEDQRNMVSVTPVNLPYSLDIQSQTSDLLHLSIKGTKKCWLTFYACVSAKDLQRVVVEKKYSGTDSDRTFADVLDLISLWASEPVEVRFPDEGLIVHMFSLSQIPVDVRELLVDMNFMESHIPLIVHLRVSDEEIETLSDENEIQSISTSITMEKSPKVPSAPPLSPNSTTTITTATTTTPLSQNHLSSGYKFQLSDQYIRTISQRTFQLKRLYKSGVDNLDCEPASSSSSSSHPPTHIDPTRTTTNHDDNMDQELCIICQEHEVSRALLPCRHCCCCKMCFSQLRMCPICRVPITSYFLVKDEHGVPNAPPVHDTDDIGSLIQNEGIWSFIKSIWNAS